jgi:tripartite-type tricarboxylate transporter receptor subunit TctC
MNRNCLYSVILAAGIFFAAGGTTDVFSAEFYKGKTLRVNVGSSPGGGYDTYARLIARHLPRHIPGNPNTIVENMPGAGGLIAANYLFNVAKPNGLTIGHINWSVPQMEFLGTPAVRYRSLEFEWLGLANSSVITVVIGKDAPIQTVEEWINPKTPKLIFGCNSRTDLTCATALALNDIFGPISKVVPGFGGTSLMRAAVLRKETDALTGWTWDSVKATGLHLIDKGDFKILAYIGDRRYPDLEKRKATFLNPFVKKAEDKAFLKVLTMPSTMVRPWTTVPGTSKSRVKILRTAFVNTLKDPVFLKDAKRLKVEIAPKSAKWLTQFIRKTKAELKPEVIKRARKALGLE